ncbi:hypothetical protein M5D96_005386 [Drosophila gunungcola]|uniref:Uncharacterized protein n=1 Tax=Drosophila gunungcola TaxID=103775 RepID=A0A9Q0BRI0_9MUSC|nr:hypothetical protein M5D96_005386 [Drosophila gunungcola]
MQLLAWIYLLSWFLPWVKSAYDVVEPTVGQNITEYLHARQKRHQLIYRNGGTIRLVVGAVMSTQLEDPVVWRSMVYYYVLHFGAFTLPSAPLYPWDKWETIYARSLQEKIRSLDESHEDDTRTFAYAALENYMDQVSGSVGRGRQCLLRGICENAQVHHHHGIMAELLNVLLTKELSGGKDKEKGMRAGRKRDDSGMKELCKVQLAQAKGRLGGGLHNFAVFELVMVQSNRNPQHQLQ